MARDIELIWVGWEATFRIFRNKFLVRSGQHICDTPRPQPFGRYRGEGGRGADNLFLVALDPGGTGKSSFSLLSFRHSRVHLVNVGRDKPTREDFHDEINDDGYHRRGCVRRGRVVAAYTRPRGGGAVRTLVYQFGRCRYRARRVRQVHGGDQGKRSSLREGPGLPRIQHYGFAKGSESCASVRGLRQRGCRGSAPGDGPFQEIRRDNREYDRQARCQSFFVGGDVYEGHVTRSGSLKYFRDSKGRFDWRPLSFQAKRAVPPTARSCRERGSR